MTLSLCMIVRDEEAVLARCLESVKDAFDEIILADTGSRDRTKEIAAAYTDKIYDFPWEDDFSAARNFAADRSSGEYWMWLDADDVLSPEACAKLKKLKQMLDPETDIVMMPYGTAFDEQGRPAFTYYRERILKNIPEYRFQGRVHEAVVLFGKIRKAEILVEHRPEGKKRRDRNLRIYEKMKAEGKAFTSRELYYYGRELLEHGSCEEAERVLSEFLRRPDGWVEDRIAATRCRSECFRRMGCEKKAAEALLEAFLYESPRAETCCALGDYFMKKEMYRPAAWWFEQALSSEKQEDSGAFICQDCYGYLPAINLCVCYDRLGDLQRAAYFNEMAGVWKPEDPSYLKNREYFLQRQNENCGI